MTTLIAPRPAVKTTRPAVAARCTATGPALARALFKALRRLESLIPGYHRHPAKSAARGRWLDRVWFPANEALDQSEKAVLAHLHRRGVSGLVAGGRLYLDLCYCMGDISEYRGTGVLVVELADVPDLATGPDPADAQHWAEQSPDHHTTEETPVEVLGDGPEPDWDAMGEEALALDSYSRGFLPL